MNTFKGTSLRLLLTLVPITLASTVLLSGCGSSKQRESIAAAMAAVDKTAKKGGVYPGTLDDMRLVDLSGCPLDFRKKWGELVTALEGQKKVIDDVKRDAETKGANGRPSPDEVVDKMSKFPAVPLYVELQAIASEYGVK